MGAYVRSLPSTPQMARYTAAPSNYIDPTVRASPPAWWGSSLGGCGSCGLGADGVGGLSPLLGGAAGLLVVYVLKSRPKPAEVALGFVGGMVLGRVL